MDITSYLLGKNASGGGGGSDLDWSALGFNGEPTQVVNTKNQINSNYDYAKEIQDTWIPSTNLDGKYNANTTIGYMPTVDTSTATNMYHMFWGCLNLYGIAPLDTSNVLNMSEMCRNCSNLIDFPLIDASKLTSDSKKNNMFANCAKLSDKSLDNILQMCIGMTSLVSTATKTLASIGIANTYTSRIQALPHYQAFLDAGWTIGY